MSGAPVEGVGVWMAADGCIILPTIGPGRMIATCTGTDRVKCEVISIVPKSSSASVVPLLKREPFRRDHYRHASPLARVLNPLLPSADASFGSDNVFYHSLLGGQARIRILTHLSEKPVRPDGLTVPLVLSRPARKSASVAMIRKHWPT